MKRRKGEAKKYNNVTPCKRCGTHEQYESNRQCIWCKKIYGVMYHSLHKEKRNADHMEYYYKHQKEAREYANGRKIEKAKYDKGHRELYREKKLSRRKERLKTDTNFKLSEYLRSRLRLAVKSNQKVGSAVKDLGCTVEEFKTYIESQMEPWMTWDNWKLKPTKEHPRVWHLDHKRPLSSFDLTDRAQFLEASHYTNLQPLEASENLKKGKKTC